MINAVGRDIPDAVLAETGKTVFRGSRHFDGYSYEKTAVKIRARIGGDGSKLENDLQEVLRKCNAHDGMTISFHHHFGKDDRSGYAGDAGYS